MSCSSRHGSGLNRSTPAYALSSMCILQTGYGDTKGAILNRIAGSSFIQYYLEALL